jgi:hypothetical protein
MLVGLYVSRLEFVPPVMQRYTPGLLGNQFPTPLASMWLHEVHELHVIHRCTMGIVEVSCIKLSLV